MRKGVCLMVRHCCRLKTLGTLSWMVPLMQGSSVRSASPCYALELSRTAWRMASGLLVKPPLAVCTLWMVRRPVSFTMRLAYCMDLYGMSLLLYLSRSLAAAAMRQACHSWSWWRLVVKERSEVGIAFLGLRRARAL